MSLVSFLEMSLLVAYQVPLAQTHGGPTVTIYTMTEPELSKFQVIQQLRVFLQKRGQYTQSSISPGGDGFLPNTFTVFSYCTGIQDIVLVRSKFVIFAFGTTGVARLPNDYRAR